MSNLEGSISASSRSFNELGLNDTIQAIKTASYLQGQIERRSLEQEKQKLEQKKPKTQELDNLAGQIREDMER